MVSETVFLKLVISLKVVFKLFTESYYLFEFCQINYCEEAQPGEPSPKPHLILYTQALCSGRVNLKKPAARGREVDKLKLKCGREEVKWRCRDHIAAVM